MFQTQKDSLSRRIYPSENSHALLFTKYIISQLPFIHSITLISLSLLDENGSIQAEFERRNKDMHVWGSKSELLE